MTSDTPLYYVYVDDEHNRYYYYHAISGETSYSRPKFGTLLDPTTKHEWQFPENDTRTGGHSKHSPAIETESSPSPHRRRRKIQTDEDESNHRNTEEQADGSGPVVTVEERAVAEFGVTAEGSVTVEERAVGVLDSRLPTNEGETQARTAAAMALPSDLKSDIHQFQAAQFARQFFREHRAGGLFSRKVISAETLSSFQSTPIKEPLLKNLPARLDKLSVEMFKIILTYTGADGSEAGNVNRLMKFVTAVSVDAELRDEAYMQLIKQTRENPNPEWCYHTWELFLLAATLFPSTRNSEHWIKAHIAECLKNADPRLAEIVQFTFIRYTARCAIGKTVDGPFLPGAIRQIMSAHLETAPHFGASLHEQVWCQRTTYPLLPIPMMVHQIATALLASGAEGREGVFRLPGNMKKVSEMQTAIGERDAVLDSAEIHDLGSLFKAWFSNLPESIVGQELVPALKTASETHTFIEFANALPQLPQLTLKYLIGFLRRMAKSEAVTRMGPPNLAMVFAPNIVDVTNTTDPMQVAKVSEVSKEFLMTLINEWDVSDIYPLNPEILVRQSD
jgi:hypothetical protein